jgi:peptidoglycan/xylan/chitin deacetylase (PgdA/CDA1 family)
LRSALRPPEQNPPDDKESWLPDGKRAAVCFTVDDVHPTDVAFAALDHVRQLQERHPQLKVTFFTTPDWRSIAPFPEPSFIDRIPIVRDALYRVPRLPRHTYRLDLHEEFCARLREWPRAEIAIHGLHHVTRGRKPIAEFEGASRRRCRAILERALQIFADAKLRVVRGLCPPAWSASDALLAAMSDLAFKFIGSARDLTTPIARHATTNGSGLKGVSLIEPQLLKGGITHITTNVQATVPPQRAIDIVENGGLVAIKAHLLTGAGSYKALDGLTDAYGDELDRLFTMLEARYGDALWWTSMGEIRMSEAVDQ